MGKKSRDAPRRRPCSVCKAEGGWWETGNGKKFGKRRWITCWGCKGNKYV
jgi:hypothetical protein